MGAIKDMTTSEISDAIAYLELENDVKPPRTADGKIVNGKIDFASFMVLLKHLRIPINDDQIALVHKDLVSAKGTLHQNLRALLSTLIDLRDQIKRNEDMP